MSILLVGLGLGAGIAVLWVVGMLLTVALTRAGYINRRNRT